MEQNKKHVRITVEELDEQGIYIPSDVFETDGAYLFIVNSMKINDVDNVDDIADVTMHANNVIVGKGTDLDRIRMLLGAKNGISEALKKEFAAID